MKLVFIYSYLVCGFWLFFTIYLLYNKTRVSWLRDIPPISGEQPPVVVIIAVRNEEEHLAKALHSVCALDYKQYSVFVVNDRSTDHTGEILASFQSQYSHLHLYAVTDLPKGWLGKNHALYQGYLHTQENWMLFTDADIIYKPDTLGKAMQYVLSRNVDHLTLLPEVHSRSTLLNSILSTFVLLLEGKYRPWALRNPQSHAYLGIGAFNLVRRDAYKKMGTHKAFSLRPDDDLVLGKKMKENGFSQDALYAEGQVSLEWYISVRAFIDGLMKNSFTAFRYRFLGLVVTGALPMFLFLVLPLPLLLVTGQITFAVSLLLIWLLLFSLAKGSNTRWWHALMLPVAGVLMIFILFRAAFLTNKHKGIYWRESFYPLDELRAGL
jgi:cellulose synthase/poly-beta-1,6-N-acetylglucosamine synthase-like glycosyltransferase